MVVHVEIPGSQAGEVDFGEVIKGVNRFAGPWEAARVNIGEPDLEGRGADAALGVPMSRWSTSVEDGEATGNTV